MQLPIHINQTTPIIIELLRIDLDTNINETIELTGKMLRTLVKTAQKGHESDEEPQMLKYTVKRPGLYRLQKVIDETKLEVQRRTSDTLVLTCPKAEIRPATTDKCIGELSDLTIDVEGTPPLRIKYSQTINKKDQSFHFQSIQPKDFESPLLNTRTSGALVSQGAEDVSWAQAQSIPVRLNMSMATGGNWVYSIDEVQDATGNVANFSARGEDGEQIYPKNTHMQHEFAVHERPFARLNGYDSRNPLRVAKGSSTKLPIEIKPDHTVNVMHTVEWYFSPIDKLTATGDHGEDVTIEKFVVKNPKQRPDIQEPGLYTLKSVRSPYCDGEIREPASCMLVNPPEPDLSISSENIYDKCAGNSIGLLVDLDLIGTPPFLLRYDVAQTGSRNVETRTVRVHGLRHQLELKPRDAGHFTYRFKAIDDEVYKGHSLTAKDLVLEQDVKPPASAYLLHTSGRVAACMEEPVQFDVQLQGEAPFTLEYELVYEGKRSRQKVENIETQIYTIATKPLLNGGEYSLALASVQDKTGCKIFLKGDVKIDVRRQRPKASFGQVDGKRTTLTLEGKKIGLPLRLTGEAPWSITYRNMNDSSAKVTKVDARYTNDLITVDQRGIYEILSIYDNHCPGTVDAKSSTFGVDWISRPDISFASSSALVQQGDKYLKQDVCEGDVDAVEISLNGLFCALLGAKDFAYSLRVPTVSSEIPTTP